MATHVRKEETPTPPSQLVEMSWDPITRIVGSLGIYTKIDFKNRKIAECHSTSSIFRGYSLFMQGKDPRDAHFITSRICGICGERMKVIYHVRAGHRVPDYICDGRTVNDPQAMCQWISGKAVDEAVGDLLLEIVTPE